MVLMYHPITKPDTESEAEQDEIDGLYNQAGTDLKSSNVWKNHECSTVAHYYVAVHT